MLLLLLLAAASSDPGTRLDAAISRYESAQFARAKDALIDLLEDPALGPRDRARARTYLAAAYLALNDKSSAALQLRTLAREQPDAKPSRATFAANLIALADEVWADVEKRRAQQKSADPPPPTPPPAVTTEPAPTADGPPPRALAFMPLGIGHFARGAPAQGVLWLVAELGLFVASAVTLALMLGPKAEGNGLNVGVPGDALRATQNYNVLTSTCFIAGLVAVVGDVVIGNLSWPSEAQ